MTTTHPEVDRRVVRWMSRRGQGLRLSAAAALLLAPRLRVRWWAGVALSVGFVGFFVGWWWWLGGARSGGSAGSGADFARLAAPYVVLALVVAAFALIGRRRDLRLAEALPTRVTRPGAVGVRAVLGTPLCIAVVVAGAVHLGVLIAVARTWSWSVALAYGLGLVAIGAAVGIAVAVVVRRPTVALDASSLAVDERLRSRDAVAALTGWFYCDMVVGGGLPSGHADTAATLIFVGLVPLLVLALVSLGEQGLGSGWRW